MTLSPTIARFIVAPEQAPAHRERAFHVRPASGAGRIHAGQVVLHACWQLRCAIAVVAFRMAVPHVVAAMHRLARQLGALCLQAGGVDDFLRDGTAGHGGASGAVADPSTMRDREA